MGLVDILHDEGSGTALGDNIPNTTRAVLRHTDQLGIVVEELQIPDSRCVTPTNGQLLTAFHIPQSNGTVIGATRYVFPIVADHDIEYRTFVSSQIVDLLLLQQIPDENTAKHSSCVDQHPLLAQHLDGTGVQDRSLVLQVSSCLDIPLQVSDND